MPSADRLISYLSIAIVLFVGVMILAGYIGFLEPVYRIGFGLAIIAYAGVRLMMMHLGARGTGKRP